MKIFFSLTVLTILNMSSNALAHEQLKHFYPPMLVHKDRLNSSLFAAVHKKSLETIKKLIALGADVNARSTVNMTPLMLCADAEIAEYLLSQGADVNAFDEDKMTVLMHQAVVHNNAIVKLLIQEGAAIDSVDRWGKTALSWAKTNAIFIDQKQRDELFAILTIHNKTTNPALYVLAVGAILGVMAAVDHLG